MRKFFLACEREKVRYLLISGQAAVLYGASAFTEDTDLWIDPAPRNLRRLVRALRRAGARIYKLTPPLESRYVRRRHGFHFTLPGQPFMSYLDVMGMPPRVRGFAEALGRSHREATPWGRIPVVAIEDLVELKKTRRLQDYDTISLLARIRLERDPGGPGGAITRRTLRWALKNLFRAEDLHWLLESRPGFRAEALRIRPEPVRALVDPRTLGMRRGDRALAVCRRAIALEIAGLQQRDVRYWSPVVRQLRTLRAKGGLMEVGAHL